MLQLTTGLIENKPELKNDKTPTCVVPLKSISILNRPIVTLGVKVLNGDTTVVSIEIKGFYIDKTAKVEYISDIFYIAAGNMALRQYYIQFDTIEFQFFPSSQNIEIFAWGIDSAGQSTNEYSIRPVEHNFIAKPSEVTVPNEPVSSGVGYSISNETVVDSTKTIEAPEKTLAPTDTIAVIERTIAPAKTIEALEKTLAPADTVAVTERTLASTKTIAVTETTLAYTPANPANWSTIPATVQEALDQLAIRNPIHITRVGRYTGATGYAEAVGPIVVIVNRSGYKSKRSIYKTRKELL